METPVLNEFVKKLIIIIINHYSRRTLQHSIRIEQKITDLRHCGYPIEAEYG